MYINFFFLDSQQLYAEVAELRRRNSELELQVQEMQEEIDALMIINESFGDESDRQRRMIEDLENRLKSATGSESEVESESESEVGSESYVESEELKKGRRVQPERKVKKNSN